MANFLIKTHPASGYKTTAGTMPISFIQTALSYHRTEIHFDDGETLPINSLTETVSIVALRLGMQRMQKKLKSLGVEEGFDPKNPRLWRLEITNFLSKFKNEDSQKDAVEFRLIALEIALLSQRLIQMNVDPSEALMAARKSTGIRTHYDFSDEADLKAIEILRRFWKYGEHIPKEFSLKPIYSS